MLKSLQYDVTFPTGRRLAANLEFAKGLTAITGSNECGKSFTIEMVRYGFFGTGAFRGSADDYKTLKMSMTFDLRGADCRVERTTSNAKFFRDGALVATGTRPVNERLLKDLGFDLGVFDVACAANQDEVLALGSMKPTERKRMVDQVIGLDRMDEIQKWVAEQATLLGREILVLDRGLVQPSAPTEPEGYQPSTVLQAYVDSRREAKSYLDGLKGWLSHTRTEPVAPVQPAVTDRVALEAELVQIDEVEAARRHVLSMPIIDPELSAAWAAYDEWQIRLKFEREHPQADMTSEGIEEAEASHDRWRRIEELKRKLVSLRADPNATCPSCKTTFSLSHDHIREVEDALNDIAPGEQCDLRYLQEQRKRLADWASADTLTAWEWARKFSEAPQPSQPRPRATEGITAAEQQERLSALPSGLRDRSVVAGEIRKIDGWVAASTRYDADKAAYDTWLAEWAEKKAEADRLSEVVGDLAEREAALRAAITYEAALDRFHQDNEAYVARKAELDAKRDELTGWQDAKGVLVAIRAEVKTHLVPSLSKVASHLLAQMTGGQRSSIVVNEEFDITVDGQKLETLSGSGKACANLALRIGLGQVLTNNVLSLFIGDEIDASMDADRASNTQDSLRSLTAVISQILLVTHKTPTADTVIRLG